MDPNSNLEEQLRLVKKLVAAEADCRGGNIDPIKPQRLAELVQALDEWIVRGGFLPERWSARDREARELLEQAVMTPAPKAFRNHKRSFDRKAMAWLGTL